VAILLDSILHVWRTEMGDPDALGWATTVAYLIAAALCARTALATRGGPPDAPPGDRPGPWWLLSAGLLLLGLNKQLDLQILVRELGIRFIDLLGMDAQRRWFGRAFVLLMALFLLRVMREAVRQMRGHTRGHHLLLTGLALLACFAVLRAGTYIPGLKQMNMRFSQSLHLVFEFGGILLVGSSAVRTRQRLVRFDGARVPGA
jgi:hypothetical protein